MKDYVAGEAQWQLPTDHAPPLGVWQDWAVAWAPLPKVPEHIKQQLSKGTT